MADLSASPVRNAVAEWKGELMKTWNDEERRELQLRIETATGIPFTHPLPEFFFKADSGPAMGMNSVVHPKENFVSVEVLLVSFEFGIHRLGKFRYN
jgi:hypothetical protein